MFFKRKKKRIALLNQVEKVRKKACVIFGDDGREGAFAALKMLVGVFANPDFGSECSHLLLIQKEDNSFTLRCNGKGLYLNYGGAFDEQIWRRLFCEVECADKFSAKAERLPFFDAPSFEGDERGVADYDLCAVQCASSYMTVETVRGGIKTDLTFDEGWFITGSESEAEGEADRNEISFKLDERVFTDTDIPRDDITAFLKDCAVQNPGLKCEFSHGDGAETVGYVYARGSVTLLSSCSAASDIPVFFAYQKASGKERYNKEEYTAEVAMALCFAEGKSGIDCFHNFHRHNAGGTHLDTLLEKLCEEIDWFFADDNALSYYGPGYCDSIGVDYKITPEDLKGNMMLVLETKCEDRFTKLTADGEGRLCNRLIEDMTYDLADEEFRRYLKNNSFRIGRIMAGIAKRKAGKNAD